MTDLTKDEIVKMAREAGLWVDGFPTEHIERFYTLCRADLVAELEQAKKDAERYRWLTADHADAEMRDLAEDTGIRLRWMSKGSADAAIDAAIAKEQS